MLPTVSALVITKNEEGNIGACLETLRWVDEVLIVDAESTDRTVEIASRYTQEIFIRPWSGYGPQKNVGIERARAEWILIVDADERITPALREEIQAVLKARPPGEIAGYEIPRRNFFYGRWVRGGGLYPDYQLRLFRKVAGRYDDTRLHEHLRLHGRIERLRQPLDHHSMPTIRAHVRKMMRYTTLGAEEKLKSRASVTALDLAGRHLWTILKTFLLRGGYWDGVHGAIVALFAGMHTFVKYAKAWESLNVRGSPSAGERRGDCMHGAAS
jgi:glycosyltransferase involved in cell wall biosynthesis